jgi:predicted transcriptional regulator
MAHNREILESLITPSVLKILKLFLNNEDQKYYLREIAKLTKIPPATVYRVVGQLVDNRILQVEHIKRFKLYYYNIEEAGFLADLLQDRKSAVTEFVKLAQEFEGVDMVVLHGKEDKDRANILVIGNNMDTDSIKRNALYISDKYSFKIILLTLAPEQYNQMSSMGLYPGKKRILFEAE